MSASRSAAMFTVPWSYRGYRALILVVFVLILVFAGLGAAGHGPVSVLHKPTDQAVTWVKKTMGISEHVTKKVVKHHVTPKKTKKKKKKHKKKREHKKASG
jgi:hypothetical protein